MKQDFKNSLKQIYGVGRISEKELQKLKNLYRNNVEYLYDEDKNIYGNIIKKLERLFELQQTPLIDKKSSENTLEIGEILKILSKYEREAW